MKDLKIPPAAQIAALATLGAAAAATVAANFPEIQRYLKIERM
jgi:hypothetical protein